MEYVCSEMVQKHGNINTNSIIFTKRGLYAFSFSTDTADTSDPLMNGPPPPHVRISEITDGGNLLITTFWSATGICQISVLDRQLAKQQLGDGHGRVLSSSVSLSL